MDVGPAKVQETINLLEQKLLEIQVVSGPAVRTVPCRSPWTRVPMTTQVIEEHYDMAHRYDKILQETRNLVDNSVSVVEKLDFTMFYCKVKKSGCCVQWCLTDGMFINSWEDNQAMMSIHVTTLESEHAMLKAKHPTVSPRLLKTSESEDERKTEEQQNREVDKLINLMDNNLNRAAMNSRVTTCVTKKEDDSSNVVVKVTMTIKNKKNRKRYIKK